MLRMLKALSRDNRGATVIEYGLICSLIVLAMMAALQGMAGTTINMWNKVSTKMQNPY